MKGRKQQAFAIKYEKTHFKRSPTLFFAKEQCGVPFYPISIMKLICRFRKDAARIVRQNDHDPPYKFDAEAGVSMKVD